MSNENKDFFRQFATHSYEIFVTLTELETFLDQSFFKQQYLEFAIFS